MEENNEKKMQARPPVVAVMGHIDHGKSTLLDYIRKTNTTTGEAGGITQHINAYETECEVGGQKRKITFLDTPGHEAFCSVRERGARVADIAVLVVSAEDGVKPQTLEILKCLRADQIPFIVALNKIDKPGVNIDKIKQNLAENDVLVEGWGGTIPIVPVSAKTGQNIDELLEVITLQADIEGFKADPNILASGFIIESNLNPKQGISATIIIKDGTLKLGSFIASQGSVAKVKSIENFRGENVDNATFSSPIKTVGWDNIPLVGKEFVAFDSKDEAFAFAQSKINESVAKTNKELKEGSVYLDLIVKADTSGSLEAVEYELQKLNTEKMAVRIISKGIGTIGEKDVKTAGIKKNLIIGFNVSIDKGSEALALRDNIEIKNFKIIYELTDFIKEKIKTETPVSKIEVMTGKAKILRTFSKNKDKQVIGGRVNEGEIKIGSTVKIVRREALVGEGKIKELQVQKIKTDLAKNDQEFGMMIESKIDLVEGDFLQAMSWVKE